MQASKTKCFRNNKKKVTIFTRNGTTVLRVTLTINMVKVKVIPQQAEVAQGIRDRLRPRIFLTFGTTRVAVCQPNVPAGLYPRRNPWYSFSEAESTSGPMVPSVGATEKIPNDTTGNRSRYRPTSSAVP